ncbi:inter-alpha-trypsin inhibitor heavy chain H3-like [Leptodactylus fuscus]
MGSLQLWSLLLAALVTLCLVPPCHGGSKMEIRSLHIHSRVSSRFARTFVTTVIQNVFNSSKEAIFEMELPKTAFITNFTMIIDNVTNVGIVKEKAEAKKKYQKAVSRGQSAGLVQSTGRKMENFKISVNVGAQSTATFKLVYEELLKRQLGNYEFYLRVRPKELVENFQISVDIIEPQGIRGLKAVGTFMTNELSDMVRIFSTEKKAHIEFRPTLQQQRRCPDCAETLLDGDLKITYDVKRETAAGKVQIVNGYFVHYFAPDNLKRLPKNVLFVIDHSGSMYGNKIKQTYEAFTKILEEMPQEDYIGILIFDDKVDYWKKNLVRASPKNIKKAKEFVEKMTARGGTDINKALLTAAKILTNATINNALHPKSASMILFLSDGEPTSGTTEHKQIIDNVKRFLDGQAALYCLGFGSGVDYNFLEKLALENGGMARRIYEDSDSALQLQGFYNEVANPMLLDIELQYLENSVDSVTRSSFKHYYQGSEIIVAGRISNNSAEAITAEVKAQGFSEPFSVTVDAPVQEEDEVAREQRYIFGDFTERLWAYLTIEQLLSKQISAEGEDKQKITEKALDLSLKYNFVTPLTSMVVTPPEDEEKLDEFVANKPKEQGLQEYEEILFTAKRKNGLKIIKKRHQTRGQDGRERSAGEEYFEDLFTSRSSFDSHYYGHYDLEENVDLAMSIIDNGMLPTFVSQTPRCEPFHVLLGNPDQTARTCFLFTSAENVTVYLFRNESAGITVTGTLSEDGGGFTRFVVENQSERLRVNVSVDNITVRRDQHVASYDWTRAIERPGILKMKNKQVTFPLKVGTNFTIALSRQSLHPSIYIEGSDPVVSRTVGVIGQLIDTFKKPNAGETVIPIVSFADCDLTPYGEGRRGPCDVIRLSPDNLQS